ncbi:3'-5' exonuclease [Agrobacterium radiobacter]|jgi:DNA polymerase-3 subunit epsilon|uniref:DNA polymerase III subunit epsilon n=1 Tax=Agrobacterium tumefaciens str. B6 TaxID=1183423 RepID=A0A822V6Q0_AGRTU|nr:MULTISPECIES: 3'-5' exonuclease [Agrobacterium tumefaciens complex]EPR10291.1 DNA polymerase III subunit epsilon [Agrobacterium radiobacter DSM 30147]KAB0456322.1 3'-5' exonuclease [Agrobacterium tumefaciens]MBB4408603.1 DNA polymerase-3 subunit epsilon [Agrobacterium radiobacter]MBB4454299.1 DNA polymerase-3 subunit epsilon [Agrobacterium radiobacter]MBP2542352.1 DNA polymerase-3 subunit epsilon [Agrobacterium tumefaciens]
MTSQLDFFAPASARLPQAERGRKAGGRETTQKTATDDETLAGYLESTGNYRVLRRLQPRAVVDRPRPEFPRQGVILDTETTGLDHRTDEIIEIGVITFTFDDNGAIGDVTGIYGGLRQPAIAIPEEITRLTGITDEMVAGQSIDMARLTSLIADADLIVAHNASFDRPFCEAFSPIFRDKAWACSVSEIDWRVRGFEGNKLGYLIGQSGYFHDGHRAVDDCFALLEVLEQTRPGQSSAPFAELREASQRSRVRLYAENSPFDMKDHLKKRGYRWSDGSDGRPKSWWVELPEEKLDEELHFLRTEIYRWDADPTVKYLTAFDRFKAG